MRNRGKPSHSDFVQHDKCHRIRPFKFQGGDEKGCIPNEDAVRKAFYLRIVEMYKKWNDRPVANWAFVRNQLAMDDKMQERILRYEQY